MKRKILMKEAVVASMLIIIMLLLAFMVGRLKEEKSSLISVCVAARDIMPRTKITAGDIDEVTVPQAYVGGNIYLSAQDIIGKYTDIQGKIPAGSPFYTAMLFEEEELGDLAALELREGQISFLISQDEALLASFTAGERVDVYFAGEEVSGLLFEHARIIALRDAHGIATGNADAGSPSLAEIAVDRKDGEILAKALSKGSVVLHSTAKAYDTEAEALLYDIGEAYIYLSSFMKSD